MENTIQTMPFADRWAYRVDSHLPPLVLQEALKQVKDLDYQDSVVSLDLQVDKNIRASSNDWLYWDNWLAGILHNLIVAANRDYFQYDLSFFDCKIQATSYTKDQYYDWHVDGNTIKPNGEERKLSISFLLNDDYEGGEIELAPLPIDTSLYSLKAGEALLFPSWLPHRVRPVTSGTRYSLVAWMAGPRFK